MGGIRPETKAMKKRKARRKAERTRRTRSNLGIPPAANETRKAASKR